MPFNNKASICKGMLGRHAVTWMERYFSKQCDIMPTTGRLPVMTRMRPHKAHLVHQMDLKEKAYRWKVVVLIHNFWAVFKKPLCMRHCFFFGPYFLPFFNGQFLKCDILLVSNDPVF